MVEFEKIFGQDYPAKGKLLVSEPFLIDPSFRRTVVLLTEHDKNGTVGFILNRELDVGPGEAIEGFPEFKGKLFLGGPVQQTNLFFIHTLGKKIEGSVSVKPGIWWGGNYEQIKELVRDGEIKKDQIKFFIGYSGWDAGQLDKELRVNSWIVADSSVNYLFKTPPEELWKKVLKNMGKLHGTVADYPEDPNLN